MEYIIVSEDVVNAFVTTVQKHCGITRPIKFSHIPDLLKRYKENSSEFIESYTNGGPIDTVTLGTLSYIRPYAFYAYDESINAEFSALNRIYAYAFCKCSKPFAIGVPVLKTIDKCAFMDCVSLSSIRLPMIQSIGESAFRGCTSLQSVYITTDSVPTLANSNAFLSTLIASTGSIFVNASLVSAFKSASQWSYYADRITKV